MSEVDDPPPPDRREFLRNVATLVGAAATTTLPGCLTNNDVRSPRVESGDADTFEYIVVGTGAGGGPVAANLVKAGHRVLVLEAGGDGRNPSSQARYDGAGSSPYTDPELGWSFWVNNSPSNTHHYNVPGKGNYYPRGATIGGSTAVNSLIALYPANEDWDHIAELMGDRSWQSGEMRRYFQRLEDARYIEPNTAPEARHGWGGWLPLELAGTRNNLLRHPQMAKFVSQGVAGEPHGKLFADAITRGEDFRLDANDWRGVSSGAEGVFDVPRSVFAGERRGTRELLLATQRSAPDRLKIRTNALATRILFHATQRTKAIGIEYLEGAHLYGASFRAEAFASRSGTKRRAFATREVIIAGGAFNSPQLLQLSGIGPASLLQRHNIPVVVDLPGVGRNLQDRLETGVVFKTPFDPDSFPGCKRGAPVDPCREEFYRGELSATYRNRVNKQAFVLKRSRPEYKSPDLVLFAISNFFRGYVHPTDTAHAHRTDHEFTWSVLKGHTRNTRGVVELKSPNPRDTPSIQFHNAGADADLEDLKDIMVGIKKARELARAGMAPDAATEVSPGAAIDTDEKLLEFLRRETWGHHASCSNKMGPASDPLAVVDASFKVRGTEGLRIVDASVFPRIPGLFIVVSVYMIAEKASDAILADVRR